MSSVIRTRERTLRDLAKTSAKEKHHLLPSEALAGHNDTRLDLISMAIKGKKFSFDKVLKMIDDMVVLLGKDRSASLMMALEPSRHRSRTRLCF